MSTLDSEYCPEQVPPPCVGGDTCVVKLSFGPIDHAIGGTSFSVVNKCPAHWVEEGGTINGSTLFNMVEKGDSLGIWLRDQIRMRHYAWQAENARKNRHDHFAMHMQSPSTSSALYLEYKSAERLRQAPGQRGLTPP